MIKNNNEINIVSGWYGPNNFGDEAILEAIVEQLETDEGVAKSSIVVFSLKKEITRSLFPDLKVVRQFPNDFKAMIRSILTLDIFVTLYYIIRAKRLYVGGGGFLSDWQSNNIGWLLQILLAKMFGAECKLWGVGIGPFIRGPSTKLASLCFRNFVDLAYVRDEVSHKELSQKLGYPGKIIVKPDPVALMSTKKYKVSAIDETKRIVFVPAYYFKNKKFNGDVSRWDCLLNNFCSAIKQISKEGFFVDIVFYQPSSEGLLHDELLTALSKMGCNSGFQFHFLNSHRDAFHLIGKCRGVISFRLHGNIMAYAIGKPFLPIIYHFKSEEFLNMVNKSNIAKILVGDGVHLRKTDLDYKSNWEPEIQRFINGLDA